MKTVVVVLDGKEHHYTSERGLDAINKADGTLVVVEPFADTINTVAVFKRWDYWVPLE